MSVWTRNAAVVGSILCLLGVAVAQDVKSDHARMKKEHAQVHQEHDAMLKKVGKWRIEHRRALAALRDIEARILDHEAELEELAEHSREHEDHIRHHDEEIAEHERGGAGKEHEALAQAHKKLMEEHAQVNKRIGTFHDDHDSLMKSLATLRNSLKSSK